MSKFIDLTGKRFERLTVISKAGKEGQEYIWKCRCICGKEVVVRGGALRRGATTSCGCYFSEQLKERNKKHGLRHTRIYKIYHGILTRCYNQKSTTYQYYGARGISMCEEWKGDFMIFYDWAMKNGYADNLSIDRKNENGDYCPENCQWVTQKMQTRNRRNNLMYTRNGITDCVAGWAERLGFSKKLLWHRLSKGWDFEKAITTPKRKSKENG
jgi:hypothetical protein